jgi:5'-methylthioadenosine phosphorylase
MPDLEIGVIGGSGLYDMDGLSDVEAFAMSTPYGSPSDVITVGTLNGQRVAFLPRHGRGHKLTPGEVPYRANIYALKKLGVRYIIAVSACGSLREEFEPGHVVIPDQLVDFTKGKRAHTFFGGGLVAHVGVAHPFSPELGQALAQATQTSGGTVHRGGTFITIEGPRFSTRSESNLFRRWGMGLIGMTTSPEAFLAAEADIAYACMAHVTDYDVWHDSAEPVTVEMVIKTLSANTALAQRTIAHLALTKENWAGDFAAHHAMKDALDLVGDWSQVPEDVRSNLAPIIDKYRARTR